MPDGRLMLIMGGSVHDDKGTYQTRSPRVAFSQDGHKWTEPQKLLAEDHWLWRVTWHNGKGYSVVVQKRNQVIDDLDKLYRETEKASLFKE